MLRAVVQIAHQLLQKIAHGDDARHTAVFVQHHGKVVAGMLHLLEQHIRPHGFGNEPGRRYRMLHHVLPAFVGEAEIALGVQNAHHLVHGALADGIAGMAAIVDGGLPRLLGFV